MALLLQLSMQGSLLQAMEPMKGLRSLLRPVRRRLPAIALIMLPASACSAGPPTFDVHDPHSPLRLVRSIALPGVTGRIDHITVDAQARHLFVAEYGNGSVYEIDLGTGKVVGSIKGLHEPQGVAWLARQNELAVACGDGTVTFYRSLDLQPVAAIRLGDDADDTRIDGRNGDLVVGFGSGGLAVIDPSTHAVIRQVKLPAHPEAFALLGSRAVVNVPGAHAIITADLDRARILSTQSTLPLLSNYALAADPSGTRVAVSYRLPSVLAVIDAGLGAAIFTVKTCGDVDDVFYRARRIVVVCGGGAVELLDGGDGQNQVRVNSGPGARTGLFVPQLDRLFVALPSRGSPAQVWELAFH
jgi:DNA-binding beta-propeller fold protein YncE